MSAQAQVKDTNKAHDAKTNWGLKQLSRMSQRSTESRSGLTKDEKDMQTIMQYYERIRRNEASRRESIASRLNNAGTHADDIRLSPKLLVSQSPLDD